MLFNATSHDIFAEQVIPRGWRLSVRCSKGRGVLLTMNQTANDQTISHAARRGAAAIAIIAAITLATRLYLRMQQSDGIVSALSYMSQYFTILTNTATLILMVWIALGNNISTRIIKAATIAIVCVGLIYHALLAHLVSLSGLDLWADHGTHTFVPLLSGLWWIFLAPKPALRFGDLILWVAWPVIYCIYILMRASYSGFYPYPFLNVPEIGWNGVITGAAGLLVGFVIAGFLLTLAGRLVSAGARRG